MLYAEGSAGTAGGGDPALSLLSERDSEELFPSISANKEGVMEGTGTRWVDCFRILVGIEGGGRAMVSMDREGTGGGD